MTKATNPKPLHTVARDALLGLGILVLGGISLFVILLSINTISGKNADKRDALTIKTAAQDIQTPSDYTLINSTYTNSHCMDVCANLSNSYVANGTPAPTYQPLIGSLKKHGYTCVENDTPKETVCEKKVEGQTARISIEPLYGSDPNSPSEFIVITNIDYFK